MHVYKQFRNGFYPVKLLVKGVTKITYPLSEKPFKLLPMLLVTIHKMRVKHD